MATKGIREIAITNDSNYLIEPTLYTTVNQTSAATTFTADLDKFELFNGVTVAVKFGVTNNANATLNINETGAKAIYYEGAAITASKLKAKHTYIFTYNGTQWELVGDLDTNTNTHRPIQVNDTQILGNNTTALNLKNGDNINITNNSGAVTITATDTTYTFANGTNGFTVTPSGGTAQTVTVTPSITNNITGTGAANYLTKFTGANTIGNSGLTTDSNNNLTIPGTIYFSSNTTTSTGKALFAYNSTYPKFGIWYKEGDPDVMAFSASGNADTTTSADFAVEGGGKLYNKGNIIPNTGNNTGNVGSTTQTVYIDGGVIKAGTTLGTAATHAHGDYALAGHDHNSTYLKLDGSNNMSNDIGIIFGDTDKFLHFKYSTNSLVNNSWRAGVLGSGTGNTNYYVIQSGGVNSSTNGNWVTTLRIGQQTYDAGFEGNVYPINNNTQTLGTSTNKWNLLYTTLINQAITGTGTVGSYTNSTYYPAKWTFNTGKTAQEGDMVTIKLPCAGHDYGVFMSIDNGANYYPVVVNGTGRVTTHYPNGGYITVIFNSSGSAASMFPLAGQTSGTRITVSGGVWQVLNYYDSGNAGLYQNHNPKSYKVGSTAITAYDLIAEDINGYLVPAHKIAHRVGSPIFIKDGALAANTTGSWGSLYDRFYSLTIRKDGNNLSLTTYAPVYLKGTISAGIFTPDTATPFISTKANCNVSGAYYMYIGDATGGTTVSFNNNHPYYYYNGTNLLLYTEQSGNAATVNGLTVQTAVPENAIFTDHYAWGDITGKPTSITLTGAVTASATTLGSGAISIATTSNHSHGNIDKDGKMTNANRLVWTGTDLKPQSTYHYATTDKIAINSTSAPSYNLYVNGTTYLSGNTTIAGSTIKFSGVGEGLEFTTDGNYFGSNLDARIIQMIDTNSGENSSIVDGGLIIRSVGRNSGTDTVRELLRIRGTYNDDNWHTGEFQWKTNDIVVETGTTKSWNISIGGNAATATGVQDAGNTSKTLTIRWSGNGANATDWIPMHASNGNLVPVSSTNLANKIRDKASGDWGINITGNATTATTAGNVTGTVAVNHGGTGETTKLAAGLIYNWTAVVQGQTWSRLCYVPASTTNTGSSILLNFRGTRSSVIYNFTLLIHTHHENGQCHINVLQGNGYSGTKIRGVTDTNGNVYIELYDDANSIAATTTQNITCNMLILTKGSTEPTLYTVFTNGATLPSGYTAHELTVVNSGGFQTTGNNYATSFVVDGTTTSLSNNNLTFAQGGGWYMNDTTWIRTVGSKSIYVNSGTLRVDGDIKVKTLNHVNGSIVNDGSWITGANGTAGDGTNAGTLGTSILSIGNATAQSKTSGAGANNAQGYLRLFSSGTGYAQVTAYSGDKVRFYPEEGISLPRDKIGIMFRPDSASYYTYTSYQTNGNEALVFATQNAVTSFIFVNGESYANVASNRWRSLTGASGAGNAPGIQIKQNCVSIGKLIDSDTNASYKLQVYGGQTYLNSSASSTSNLSGQLIVANEASTNVALELWRNANGSWQIANEGGNLYFRSNLKNSAKQTTYSETMMTIAYNTGNTTFTGSVTAAGGFSGNATSATTATNLASAPTLSAAGTATIDLSANTTYTLTVGGKSVVFKTPTNNNNYVTQSSSTTGNWRKILLHYKDDTSPTAAITYSTNIVYSAVGVSVQPSTGTIRAGGYNIIDKVRLEYNSTDDSLDFVFI